MVAALLALFACDPGEPDKSASGDTGSAPETGATDTADTGDSADPEDTADSAEPDDDVDRDGDGYAPRDGDCNDELPHVYPGAPDYCDGLDADCDGEAIPDGSCGQRGDMQAMWSWSLEGPVNGSGAVGLRRGDVNGDGMGDVNFDADEVIDDEGFARSGILFGRQPEDWSAAAPLPAASWAMTASDFGGVSVWAIADFNADGYDDVLTGTDSSGGYTGSIFLFPGSPEGFPYEDELVVDVAEVMWLDRPKLELTAALGAGNFDEEPGEDVVVLLNDKDAFTTGWAIMSPFGAGERVNGFDELTQLEWDTETYTNGTWLVRDLNGDGLDEFVAQGYPSDDEQGLWTVLLIVEGADLAAGGSMAAVAHRAWYEIPDTEGFWHVYADQGDEPDFTGDGLPDLTLSHSSDHNEVLVISGGIPAGAMNDDVHARITSDELSGMPLNQPVADMDGDGVPEIMIGLDMLESTVLRAGGTLDLDTYPHFRFDNYDVPLLMAATDLTGDHRPEFVFVDTQWDVDNTGVKSMRTLFIEGFDLPWDDPSKW